MSCQLLLQVCASRLSNTVLLRLYYWNRCTYACPSPQVSVILMPIITEKQQISRLVDHSAAFALPPSPSPPPRLPLDLPVSVQN